MTLSGRGAPSLGRRLNRWGPRDRSWRGIRASLSYALDGPHWEGETGRIP